MATPSLIHEADFQAELTTISASSKLTGTFRFGHLVHIYGECRGTLEADPGSLILIGESGCFEGDLHGDTLLIDGFVSGKVYAKTRVVISRTGRVIGDIVSPCTQIESGAFFQGQNKTPPIDLDVTGTIAPSIN